MSLPDKYVAIDEEGFPLFGEVRVTDPLVGAELLKNIRIHENGAFVSELAGTQVFVEAFDEPYVVQQILKTDSEWKIQLPYFVEFKFNPTTFTVDEWDRFHGVAVNGVPFVLTRKAQAELFRIADEYDDDSITLNGKKISVTPWMTSDPEISKEQFWTKIYQTEEPRWELNQPAPALVDMLPRLKISKSRVLVLGCGSGNDAAFFAQAGHLVTAIDISPEALQRARSKYGHLTNLTFIESDVFTLGQEYSGQFDVIFEHTCYCAIQPERRNELVKTWRRLLSPGGHLLGVFFAMERRSAPPFGGTEWELRERLKKYFHFIFWGRWHQSIQNRNGKELLVYAQMK
ncbi:MAG: hypothetical protein BroJett040_12900 [Oligoflexia bacterium]|nr:MAG: hypothetical protein BroJett040_12900 [Oligoflexia bacterium]